MLQCVEMVKAFLPLYLEYISQFDVSYCVVYIVSLVGVPRRQPHRRQA